MDKRFKRILSTILVIIFIFTTNGSAFATILDKHTKGDVHVREFIDKSGMKIRIEISEKNNITIGKQYNNGKLVQTNIMKKGGKVVKQIKGKGKKVSYFDVDNYEEDLKGLSKSRKKELKNKFDSFSPQVSMVKAISYGIEDSIGYSQGGYQFVGTMDYRVDGKSIDAWVVESYGGMTTYEYRTVFGRVIDVIALLASSLSISWGIADYLVGRMIIGGLIAIGSGVAKSLVGSIILSARSHEYYWKLYDADNYYAYEIIKGTKYIINDSEHLKFYNDIKYEGYGTEHFNREDFRDMSHKLIFGTISNPVNIY